MNGSEQAATLDHMAMASRERIETETRIVGEMIREAISALGHPFVKVTRKLSITKPADGGTLITATWWVEQNDDVSSRSVDTVMRNIVRGPGTLTPPPPYTATPREGTGG